MAYRRLQGYPKLTKYCKFKLEPAHLPTRSRTNLLGTHFRCRAQSAPEANPPSPQALHRSHRSHLATHCRTHTGLANWRGDARLLDWFGCTDTRFGGCSRAPPQVSPTSDLPPAAPPSQRLRQPDRNRACSSGTQLLPTKIDIFFPGGFSTVMYWLRTSIRAPQRSMTIHASRVHDDPARTMIRHIWD